MIKSTNMLQIHKRIFRFDMERRAFTIHLQEYTKDIEYVTIYTISELGAIV